MARNSSIILAIMTISRNLTISPQPTTSSLPAFVKAKTNSNSNFAQLKQAKELQISNALPVKSSRTTYKSEKLMP